MKKTKKSFKKVLKCLGTAFNVILIAIVLVNVYTIAARIITKKQVIPVFGLSTALVETGSMEGDNEDSISGFSLIFMVKAREYKIGDVITFDSGGSVPTTHRIVGVDEDGFITKGDFNTTQDAEKVREEQIIGKVFLEIPGVGYFVHWMKTPLGSMLLVVVCLLIIGVPIFFKSSDENGDESSVSTENLSAQVNNKKSLSDKENLRDDKEQL